MIQDMVFALPDAAPFMQQLEVSPDGVRVVSEPRPLHQGAPAGRSNLRTKAVSLGKALAVTAARGTVDESRQAARRFVCTGRATLSVNGKPVDVQGKPCEHFKPDPDDAADGYCGACGCPSWRLAKMKSKWKMRAAPCPIGRFD